MLTQIAVMAAKPREKSYKLSDGAGLYLLIEPSGSKLWRLRYFFEGKEKMLSLGAFPDVTIAMARSRRDDARALLADGKDRPHLGHRHRRGARAAVSEVL